MVFFVCEGCNETLKKNKVDAHAARCRDCFAVSCVDCSVVFPGNEYAQHTSCISEAQKYEGALYKEKKPNGKGNKKQSPQEKWMQIVGDAQADPSNDTKEFANLLERIKQYDNVPRKQNKFMNFIKNSIGVRDPAMATKLYEFYDALFKAASESSEPKEQDKRAQAAESPSEKQETPSKKRKHSDVEPETPAAEDKQQTKDKKTKTSKKAKPSEKNDDQQHEIDWVKHVKKVLKKEHQQQMELKELRRKVFEKLQLHENDATKLKMLKKQFKHALVRLPEQFFLAEIVTLV